MRSYSPTGERPARRLVILGLLVLGALLLALVGWRFGAFRAGGDLQRARARWAAQHPPSYRYVLRTSCFCPPDVTEPVRVEVRDGTAVSLTEVRTGQPAEPRFFKGVTTLDELFVLIQQAIDQGADSVDVAYDPAFGFPQAIAIDYMRNAVDDEVSYSVEQFEPLK